MRKKEIFEYGHKFGNVVYIKDTQSMDKIRTATFICPYCYSEFNAHLKEVKRLSVTSCGCKRVVPLGKHFKKHGLTNTSEYGIWENMRTRCYNKNNKYYADYGGRGILPCKEWTESFEKFYFDMGPRPTIKYSLERLDNDLGYYKENCVWATKKVQANNKRNNHIIEYQGECLNIKQWSEKLELPYKLIHKRIKQFKWPIKDAFTIPVVREKKHLHKRVII